MKKITLLLLALALIAALVTGCGCRNSKPMNTVPTTMPTTMPTTAPATMPTTMPTVPTVDPTQDTTEDGNGPLPTNATAGADGDTSSATDETGIMGEGKNRRNISREPSGSVGSVG
jgi:hypothetical protein